MARVIISHFSGIFHQGRWQSSVFYDGLIDALRRAGNDVLQLMTTEFLPSPWNGNNKPFIPEFTEQLHAKIKSFNPELIITFNNSTIEGIEQITSCPIVLWDADSVPFFNDKDNIKKNLERYHYFAFSTAGMQHYKDLLGAPDKLISRVTAATSIRPQEKRKIYNISLISTYFRLPWQISKLIATKPEELIKLLDIASDLSDGELAELLSSPYYKALGLSPQHLRHCGAGQLRSQIMALLAPLGVDIFGDSGWLNIANFSIEAARGFHPEKVYSLEHNADIYNRSHISINISHTQNVSGYPWRVKDIMASNSVLVSDAKADLINDFGKDVPLQLYESAVDAYALCKKLLAEPNLRADVTAASQAAITKAHLWEHRLKDIASITGVNLDAGITPGALSHVELEIPRKIKRIEDFLLGYDNARIRLARALSGSKRNLTLPFSFASRLLKPLLATGVGYAYRHYRSKRMEDVLPEYECKND